jgi:hypothetical protein
MAEHMTVGAAGPPVHLPAVPGNGLAWDEAAVARYQVTS